MVQGLLDVVVANKVTVFVESDSFNFSYISLHFELKNKTYSGHKQTPRMGPHGALTKSHRYSQASRPVYTNPRV